MLPLDPISWLATHHVEHGEHMSAARAPRRPSALQGLAAGLRRSLRVLSALARALGRSASQVEMTVASADRAPGTVPSHT